MNKLIAILALLAINAYAGYNPNTPELVAKTKPGVVLIEVFDGKHKPIGFGTGWVARATNGTYYLVTNAHVVRDVDYVRLTTLTGVNLWLDPNGKGTCDTDNDIATTPLKDDPKLGQHCPPDGGRLVGRR